MTHPRTLLGIFVYNEGKKFHALLDEPFWSSEPGVDVLVVDDGSTDGAEALCQAKNLRCIRNDTNRGVGESIRRFLRLAHAEGYEYVVIMAGNGKMPPGEVPVFLEAAGRGYDYIQGSRFLKGFRSPNLPLFRLLAIRTGTAFFNFFLKNRYTDLSCGFRAYRVAPLFTDKRIDIAQDWLDKYELEYYIHYKFDTLGYKVTEAPCTMRYPVEAKNYSKIKPITGWWSMLKPWFYLISGLKK
jgi:dolichol-phosphate mannosyltransferase